jgi:glycerol kinase
VSGLVLGLDQGTSSTRCVVLDAGLCERGAASVAVACSFPGPGLVEQDPEAIARSAQDAIEGALADAGARPCDVAALGIANQTETFVVWERATGRPIHPAIGWQDRRTDGACAELRARGSERLVRERTGLELDATFPATKLRWVLDHIDGARAAAEDGRLAYGDVAAWLLHRLAGVHVTDAGNAGRSLLCPLGGLDWDHELLELFEVPRAILPPVVDSDGIDAVTADGIRVVAAAGDQQASLFGLRCWEAGTAKVTLGTGAFVLAQAGDAPPCPPAGILASCAWRRAGTTSYALEGFIPTAGAAVDWFTRLGALPAGQELDELLRAGEPGVVCVPVLQGFGSPSWDAGARGSVLGLHLGTTRADLARAVVDGILHQVADAVEAIGTLDMLRIDGGLSRSDWIAQRLADLVGVRVQRTARHDSTALGAATLAGLAAGLWDGLEALPEISADLVVEPSLTPAERARERDRWAAARQLTATWR